MIHVFGELVLESDVFGKIGMRVSIRVSCVWKIRYLRAIVKLNICGSDTVRCDKS